jgi:hypothetical protein
VLVQALSAESASARMAIVALFLPGPVRIAVIIQECGRCLMEPRNKQIRRDGEPCHFL